MKRSLVFRTLVCFNERLPSPRKALLSSLPTYKVLEIRVVFRTSNRMQVTLGTRRSTGHANAKPGFSGLNGRELRGLTLGCRQRTPHDGTPHIRDEPLILDLGIACPCILSLHNLKAELVRGWIGNGVLTFQYALLVSVIRLSLQSSERQPMVQFGEPGADPHWYPRGREAGGPEVTFRLNQQQLTRLCLGDGMPRAVEWVPAFTLWIRHLQASEAIPFPSHTVMSSLHGALIRLKRIA